VEPDLDLAKFQSKEISHSNYGRYTDKVLDELYQKQSRALDPEERKRYVREFERRLLDEEVHTFITLQWHRIVPHSAKVRGWTITPSHYLNQQLDAVWLEGEPGDTGMWRYILKRGVLVGPALLRVAVLLFFLVRAGPGGIA